MLGGSSLVALYAAGCLLACAIIAISGAVAAWLAALIVGAALLAAAARGRLLGKGRLQKARLRPRAGSAASRPMSKRSRKGRGDDHQRIGRKVCGTARPRGNVADPGSAPCQRERHSDARSRTSQADAAETGPPADDPEELRQEIEQTREQLGETVEQLAAKADVKARAKDKAAELTAPQGQGWPGPAQAAAGGQVQGQLAGKTRATAKVASVADRLTSRSGSWPRQRSRNVGHAGTGAAGSREGGRHRPAAPHAAGGGGRRAPAGVAGDRTVEAAMIKLLYKPVGMLVSVLGGVLAGVIFKRVWKITAREDDAPKATDARRGWREVLLAAALAGRDLRGGQGRGRPRRRRGYPQAHRRLAWRRGPQQARRR